MVWLIFEQEIRAYNIGGQCELPIDLAVFDGNREECIKHWAKMSTIQVCDTGIEAVEAVEKMFEKCFKDAAPFTYSGSDNSSSDSKQ